jgi:hypothetical protein
MTTMYTFKVRIYDIEWDVGKDPVGDGYDLDYIKSLPKEETCHIMAEDKEDAIQHALDDLSSDTCFDIQGCKTEVERLPLLKLVK